MKENKRSENTIRILVDFAALTVVVIIGTLVFDRLLMGYFAGLRLSGVTDVVQRKYRGYLT
jgi:hypothetical protein